MAHAGHSRRHMAASNRLLASTVRFWRDVFRSRGPLLGACLHGEVFQAPAREVAQGVHALRGLRSTVRDNAGGRHPASASSKSTFGVKRESSGLTLSATM